MSSVEGLVEDAASLASRCDSADAARVLDGIVKAMKAMLNTGDAYRAAVIALTIVDAHKALWLPQAASPEAK